MSLVHRSPIVSRTLAASLLLLGASLYVSRELNGTTVFWSTSGTSMYPALRSGDFIALHRANDYRPGDVIAFHRGSRILVHRIIDGNSSAGFKTKGDNRSQADQGLVEPGQIIGKLALHLRDARAEARALIGSSLAGTAAILFLVWMRRQGSRFKPT